MNAEEIANEFSAVKKAKAVTLQNTWKNIHVEGLTFSYHTEAGADVHLENISMNMPHGGRIALIGASGSGKTTFLKVIRDLYHPRQGSISLDGKILPGGFQSISHEIALIPQDPEIFSTTIRENITFGLTYNRATMNKYLDMACFSEVVKRLPKKLESSIVEKGVNLSGGEKQRLALTRGLLACADKSIVLLDEPTSSVDMRNELIIFQNIFSAFKDKTIIASVHRFHLLPLFDTVILFKEGKIIASGSHAQLLASSPDFQALWKKYQEMNEHPG
jgi:ABC-type multidrug transport system fused ATPase/permease subunit